MSTYTYPEPLNQDDAVARATAVAREVLAGHGLPDHAEIEILLWGDGPWGVRVAEVSYWIPDPERGSPFGVGGSWMQMDPDCYAVIFQAERYIVTLMHPQVDGPDGVENAEADFRTALDAGRDS